MIDQVGYRLLYLLDIGLHLVELFAGSENQTIYFNFDHPFQKDREIHAIQVNISRPIHIDDLHITLSRYQYNPESVRNA